MITYTQEQFEAMDKFVEDYIGAENAATGSLVDSNANVTNKNVITLLGEMQKPFNIQYNRYIRHKELTNLFGKELADKYISDITRHTVYQHDESHLYLSYCASISLFPFLLQGSKAIGGITNPPKHLTSFIGGLINLVNQAAASFSGAIAIPSLLICFDYFARKDYGENYLETHTDIINQELQHLVYYLNEPCSGRGGQCVFWNVSILDKHYLEGLYSNFVYPEDMSKVNFDSVMNLQKFFLTWFNKENEKEMLTFPVITSAMVKDGKTNEIKDIPFKKVLAKELSEGNRFFVYLSSSVDSLSSCCFDGEQKALVKSGDNVEYLPFEEVYDKYKDTIIETIYDGKWEGCIPIRVDAHEKDMYEVVTHNGHVLKMTEDHINVTMDRDKRASDLTKGDSLVNNNACLLTDKHEHLTEEHGAFMAVAITFGVRNEEGVKIDIPDKFSFNINLALNRAGIVSSQKNKRNTITINKPELVEVYDMFINKNKLNANIVNTPAMFRMSFIDYLIGYDIETKKLHIDTQRVFDAVSLITMSLGKNMEVSMRSDDSYDVAINDYRYDGIKRIEKIDRKSYAYCFTMENEPYFTLPNGIITHNCRLRNEIEDNTFSFTLGNVGEMTGSINVITININRLIQDAHKKYGDAFTLDKLKDEVKSLTRDIHKYHVGIRSIAQRMLDAKLYPIYDAHFIEMNRQYSTIGVNGVIEGAEYLGLEISPNKPYLNFCSDLMRWISEENKLARKEYGIMFNTEFVPGENAGHKLAQWDKKDGYEVPREIYNSYMYPVESDELNLVDKAIMHGSEVTKYLDGGSAKHDNLETYMSAEQYEKWMDLHAQTGVNYFCSNILITCCEDCGHINKNTLAYCSKCKSKNISHATRIIGFLKKIKHWSAARQKEGATRYRHDESEIFENYNGSTRSAE